LRGLRGLAAVRGRVTIIASEAYGVPYAESRERFAEAMAIIRMAWTEPTFSDQGTYHRFR
jgi:alkanesulfonate monooxygenase SsuD/methylene tetrahydromethanopterin reductase-like flavin-dependent oxidoreductase (luciferase family)